MLFLPHQQLLSYQHSRLSPSASPCIGPYRFWFSFFLCFYYSCSAYTKMETFFYHLPSLVGNFNVFLLIGTFCIKYVHTATIFESPYQSYGELHSPTWVYCFFTILHFFWQRSLHSLLSIISQLCLNSLQLDSVSHFKLKLKITVTSLVPPNNGMMPHANFLAVSVFCLSVWCLCLFCGISMSSDWFHISIR